MGSKKPVKGSGAKVGKIKGADGKFYRLCLTCKRNGKTTLIPYAIEPTGKEFPQFYHSCEDCRTILIAEYRENIRERDQKRREEEKQREDEKALAAEILPEFVAPDTQTPTRQAANVLLSLIDDNVKQLQIDTSIGLDAANDGISGVEAEIEEIKKGISELKEIFIRELCSDKVSPEIPKQIHILSQAKEKNILEVIREAGEYGIAKSEITAKSPYVGADARDLILKKFVQDGEINEVRERSEINGGMKTTYYYVSEEARESA